MSWGKIKNGIMNIFGKRTSKPQYHNILPPQEYQKRLELLRKSSNVGLPWLQSPAYPADLFHHALNDDLIDKCPPLYKTDILPK